MPRCRRSKLKTAWSSVTPAKAWSITPREMPAAAASRPIVPRKLWKSPPHCAARTGLTMYRATKRPRIGRAIMGYPTTSAHSRASGHSTFLMRHRAARMTASREEQPMPKTYWVTTYREIKDPAKLAAYAKMAPVALAPFGVRYLCRGMPDATYEAGLKERLVVSEFPSLEKAIAGHDSPGYQEALRALGDGAVRDIRIIQGLD